MSLKSERYLYFLGIMVAIRGVRPIIDNCQLLIHNWMSAMLSSLFVHFKAPISHFLTPNSSLLTQDSILHSPFCIRFHLTTLADAI